MKSPRHQTKQNLAVFPASLLKDGQKPATCSATSCISRGYLLVSALDNPKQTMLVLKLGHSLKQRGQQVSVLSI